MRIKLFPKFFILLVILAAAPAAIVGWRTISINKTGMQASILELHTNMAVSLAENVQNYLEELDREIAYIRHTLSSQMSWNERQSVIQSLLDTNENFVAVSIVDKSGSELLKAYNPLLEKDPKLINRASEEIFKSLWADPSRSALSDVYFVNDEPRINIIYPLTKTHCIYSTIGLSKIWNKITHTHIGSTGYAFMVNKNGGIIAHPSLTLAKAKQNALDLPIVQQALKAVASGSSEYIHPETNKHIVGAYSPIKKLGWGIIIQQDKNEAYMSVSMMQNQATILIIISILLAAGLVFFIARDLTNPLVKLTEAAKLVSQKNFRVRVDVKTNDELQDFADTFNLMTTELQRYDEMQVDKILIEKTKTEAVMFSIADGIVMVDLEGRLQLANKKAREILGIIDPRWENKSIFNCVKDSKIKDTVFEVINMSERKPVELNISTEQINKFYTLTVEDVISPEKKEKIGIVLAIHDITLEKDLNRMKDEFLHSITHDLRNPVTSIRGFLKFLIDGVGGPINEKQKKMLDTMYLASERLTGLINDILDIAKMESGRMELNLTKVDLTNVVQKTIDLAEAQALRKAITLSIEAVNIPKVTADSELMERVFMNLIGNAIKFTPTNGKIITRIEVENDNIKASVIDNGEGIPPEYTEKIFNKFQQVIGQRRGGTGLGLTICKHIVEAHQGTIWAESEVGKGSKFIFIIPKELETTTNQIKVISK